MELRDEQREKDERTHAGILRGRRPRHKRRSRGGFALIEVTLSLIILMALGVMMLQAGMNVLTPRQWALHQSITDAYLTSEKTLAQRLSFEQILSEDSPWQEEAQTVDVDFGRLPGGLAVSGQVIRTRVPDDTHLLDVEGNVAPAPTDDNPSDVVVWRFRSVAVYQIGGREYVKSRTVIRSQ